LQSALERAAIAKATKRLIPFLFILYIGAFLDRVNVSFAKLQMSGDLGFTEAAYGLGAGIFFIGYFLFEVPSNLIMERVGARKWIARIMITWGIISMGFFFTKNTTTFNILRFLLGAAEAGFFPGVIYYLTYWFPAQTRARAISRFMVAIPISQMFGSPLSGWIIDHMTGVNGWRGWQWLFILEGIPCVLLGIATLIYLPDSPRQAKWLEPDEREALTNLMTRERERREAKHSLNLFQALLNPKVIYLSVFYFALVMGGGYSISLFLPTLIKGLGQYTDSQVGLLAIFPWTAAAISMLVWGAHSDKTHERRWHIAIAGLVSAGGLALAATTKRIDIAILGFSLAAAGQNSMLAPFWALPTSWLSGTAAAGSIAMINSIGNLAGHFGPLMMGKLKESSGSFQQPMLICVGIMIVAVVLSICAHHDPSLEKQVADEAAAT
jgi:MFS family permease